MPELLFNLLADPLIRVRRAGGEITDLTLPEVFSGLVRDEIEAFTNLRPHQTHAWHTFLVQLAAISQHQTGMAALPEEPESWHDLLTGLTQGEKAPWSLIVDDVSKPAFMQPPVPEGNLSTFKKRFETPDALDILITAKNHDVKGGRIVASRPEHWLFALLTLQTMEGFLGAGNYGIARMNGGFSNRSCVAVLPDEELGRRFRRDVGALQTSREETVASLGLAAAGGHALLWQLPWDGTSSLSWESCDPFFIEVCRRIRLGAVDHKVYALATPTKDRRLQAEERKGDTGDAWTPINRTKATALTVSGSGFSYRLLHEVLLGNDFSPGAALRFQPDDGAAPYFYGWALVRGQGKTEGLHERRIPIPPKARARLGAPAERASIGKAAKEGVEVAASIQKSVLRPALCALLQGGADRLDFSDARAQPWLDAFDEEIDRIFFSAVWSGLALADEERRHHWTLTAIAVAERELDRAIADAPVPAIKKYRATAAAKRIFHGLKNKHFPDLAVPATHQEA